MEPKTESKAGVGTLMRPFAIAGFVALFIGFVLYWLASQRPATSAKAVMFLLSFGVFFTGFVLGAVSLLGAKKDGQARFLVISIMAVAVNLYYAYTLAMATRDMTSNVLNNERVLIGYKVRDGLQAVAQMTKDAIVDHPGWMGQARLGESAVLATSLGVDSEYVKKLNEQFSSGFVVMVLTLNNKEGAMPVSVAPATAKAHMADGSVVDALTTEAVAAAAMTDSGLKLAKSAGAAQAMPGEIKGDRMIFFPATLDVSNLKGLTVAINGREASIQGQYLTVDAKQGRSQ